MHMTARHPPITGPTLQIHVTDEAGEPRITQWHLRCPTFRAAPCSCPGLLRGPPVLGSPVLPRHGLPRATPFRPQRLTPYRAPWLPPDSLRPTHMFIGIRVGLL